MFFLFPGMPVFPIEPDMSLFINKFMHLRIVPQQFLRRDICFCFCPVGITVVQDQGIGLEIFNKDIVPVFLSLISAPAGRRYGQRPDFAGLQVKEPKGARFKILRKHDFV